MNFSLPRLYQQLFRGLGSYEALGNRIIRQIKVAHAFRQVERVRELSTLLLNISIKEYQFIAQYYLIWCDSRKLGFQPEALERITEQTQTYKSQVLFSRAAFEVKTGEMGNAVYFYTEALKTSRTVSDHVSARVAIAMVKSLEGFHQSSLKALEDVIPLIKHVEPGLFFNFYNSYATELAEAGYKEEARNISRIVIASPFAPAYPEWQETARDLKEPDRAFISVPSIEPDPVEIEPRPKVVSIQAHQAIEPEEPTRLISFPELREAPRPNQPKRVKRDDLSLMTPSQKRELLLAGIKSGRIVEGEYNKLLFISGMVESGPAEMVIDLEDEAMLKGIVMVWCNLIEPEQFAAVVSALRDCIDDSRRKEIMDNMITIAYEQTSSRTHSEREWRQKVECRLPEK
jgi:hypothetical protein